MNECSTTIWEKHSNKLKSFVCSKVNNEEVYQDILHDVFIKIKEKEARLKWVEQSASYVIKMAQNAVIDYYRNQKKSETLKNSYVSYINTEESLSEIQLADCCLLLFIKKLPTAYGEALMLTELQGLSQKQFAEQAGISYTAAKSRVQRARIKLKQAILHCCPYHFDKYGNIVDCCK